MAARAAAFSDPDVIAVLRDAFIPVAVNCSGLPRRPGPDGEYFRLIAEQGHYAGRVHPTDTRQGQYCATPRGELLASGNVRQARPLLEMLHRALAAGGGRGAGEPLPADGPAGRIPPAGGLVLRVWARDLPRPQPVAEEWHRRAFNLDHVWLTAEEGAGLLPAEVRPGAAADWPRQVLWRIARFHLLDTVRGESPPWPQDAVRVAELRTVVRDRAGTTTRLALEGRVRIEWTHRWRRDVDGTPLESGSGMDLELGGSAEWDGTAFRALELVAAGPRWGRSQYNAREGDPGPAPIGFLFELAAPGQPGGLLGDDRPPARVGERYFRAVV